MPAQELESRLQNVEAKLDRLLDRLGGAASNGSSIPPAPSEPSTWGQVFREIDSQAVAVHGDEPMREAVADVLLAMSDPEALASLGRITQLLPRIEYALQAVGAGPELLDEGMELVRERAQGNDELNRRLERARELFVTLSDTSTLDALLHIGPALQGFVPLAEATARATEAHANLEGAEHFSERLATALARLTEAETLDALVRMAQLVPRLEYAAHFAAAGPELLEEAAEVIGKKIPEDTVIIRKRIEAILDVGRSATEPATIDALHDAVKMVPELVGVLHALPRNPRTLEVLRAFNDAVESATIDAKPMGAWSLLRALGDPAVQRAMGFGVEVARSLGSTIGSSHARKELPV